MCIFSYFQHTVNVWISIWLSPQFEANGYFLPIKCSAVNWGEGVIEQFRACTKMCILKDYLSKSVFLLFLSSWLPLVFTWLLRLTKNLLPSRAPCAAFCLPCFTSGTRPRVGGETPSQQKQWASIGCLLQCHLPCHSMWLNLHSPGMFCTFLRHYTPLDLVTFTCESPDGLFWTVTFIWKFPYLSM